MTIRDYARATYWAMPKKVTNYLQSIRDDRCSDSNVYRSYFNDSKSIYIHIPKVAGKSISFALFGDDPKHHKLTTFEKIDKKKFDEYFKFSFVRNPWSRLYSTYNYLVEQNFSYPYGQYYWVNSFNDFEDFINNGLTSNLVNEYLFFFTQTSYLENSQGVIGVDFVGKFESIENDFQYVADKVKITAKLKKIGVSDVRKTYKDAYTEKMKKIVNQVYLDDVENFEYVF